MPDVSQHELSQAAALKPSSLLSPYAGSVITSALSRIPGSAADKKEACAWVAEVLADVRRFDLLVHLATAALNGDTAAARRLTESLEGVLDIPTSRGAPDAQADELEVDRCFGDTEYDLSGLTHPRAINPAALLTLFAGIAWSANSQEQLQRCLTSLASAVSSMREAERLFEIGQGLINGLIPPPLMTPMSFGGDPGLPGRGNLPNRPIPDPNKDVRGLFGKYAFKKKPVYVEGAGYIIPILSNHGDVVSCTLRFLRTLPALQQAAPKYRIDSISDPNACAGATLTLQGINFGSAGLVIFPAFGDDPNGKALVQAKSWSDTMIEVEVPAVAGPGAIELRVRDHDIKVCNQTFTLYRLGEGLTMFTGGTPSVYSLTVNGQSSEPVVVAPGSTATITWHTSQTPDTAVQVSVAGLAGPVYTSGTYAGGGLNAVAFDVPAYTTPTDLTVTVRASAHCAAVTRTLALKATVPASITIEGLEITQGVQNYGLSGTANNSLPTIAGKDTIVRAYVYADRNGFANDTVANMTGALEVDGVVYSPTNGQTPTGGTPTPFHDLGPKSALSRARTDHTFNFRIPAARCNGTRTLKLLVFGQDELGGRYESYTTTCSWMENEAMPVRWVLVRDGRTGGSGVIPTDDEARFTVLRAFDYLPTPATNIAPAWRSPWNTTTDFTNRDGPDELLDHLDNEHNCSAWEGFWSTFDLADCPSPDNALWIGLTSPTNPINRGQAVTGGNTAVAMIHLLANGAGDVARKTPAHELGHCTGRYHVNVGCGNSAPSGPYFAHPDSGDVLNVPFDPFYNIVVGSGSGTVKSFMSYGCSVWTSEYEWSDLLNVI